MSTDALEDSRFLYDPDAEEEPDYIAYGNILKLWPAPKEGKATTLLADQLFSPSILLAAAIEDGTIAIDDQTIVELGAGTALPSLLAATGLYGTPRLVTITDYPDALLIRNLRKNIDGNRTNSPGRCRTECVGYAWGTDVQPLLDKLPPEARDGYDVVILSDLLHFRTSHDDLVESTCQLLRKSQDARVYIAAGKYTAPEVCDHFLKSVGERGIVCEVGENDNIWSIPRKVGQWTPEELSLRKANVNWWIGSWKPELL